MSQLALHIPTLPDTDRGQCQNLDADTMKRCEGRMVSEVRGGTRFDGGIPYTVGYVVWTCSVCGKVVVP